MPEAKEKKKGNLERNVFFILEKHVFIKKLTPLHIDAVLLNIFIAQITGKFKLTFFTVSPPIF